MNESPIRVLVVDDHRIVREGIRSLMEEVEDIEVVGEASNGLESIDLVESLVPDVVLMDLVMPQMDGLEATRQITEKHPDIRVLVLTSFITDDQGFSGHQGWRNGLFTQRYGLKRTDRCHP